jgi:hypothetical protein
MRLSSAIVLAVVAALASSSFATATDDGVGSSSSNGKCDLFCVIHDQCKGCPWGNYCVSISGLPQFDNMAYLHGSNGFSCVVVM